MSEAKRAPSSGMGRARLSCHVRCLDEADVRKAREDLAAAGLVRVAYTCKLSGKREELLLIGDYSAERLAASLKPLGNPQSVKVLAALASAELCECDVATLLQRSDSEVMAELRQLRALGLLKQRKIEGMNYFALADEALGKLLRDHLAPAAPAGDAAHLGHGL